METVLFIRYLFCAETTNFIGVALFCLLDLALVQTSMASQEQTTLLTKSLPGRLVGFVLLLFR